MLKKFIVKLSALCLVSASLCAAELTEVLKIDGSTQPEGVTIEKNADGFVFGEKTEWTLPVSFDPADAEMEFDVKFNLSPTVPEVARKYNSIIRFNDVNDKVVARMLIVQYPDRKNDLVNFTAFGTDRKVVVCQRSLPIVAGENYSIKVRMTKEAITLSINGKVSKTAHSSTFNTPATAVMGYLGGNSASAIMTIKKLTVKSK